MKKALLFPGQGSQRVGMGRELAREFDAARRVFEEADEALGRPLSAICFEGPEAELTRIENTQPAILTNSIAVLRAVEAEKGRLGFDLCAGHSLGEFSALVAAGALGFADAARLVSLRGRAMQEAVPAGEGAMAAILGLDLPAVRAVCAAAAQGEVCEPANLNGGGQIVISGAAAAVERARALAGERGARRAVRLEVSAPFHCSLMGPAADALAAALAEVSIGPLAVPVVANVTAEPNREPAAVRDLLVRQVTAPVRWEESVRLMAADGVTRALELGSGSVLRGLCRRIAPDMKISTVGEPHEVREAEL